MQKSRQSTQCNVSGRRTTLLFLLVLGLSGCGGGGYKVEPNLASEILAATLDAWKAGKTPADLRGEADPVVVQDPDWTKGTRLTDYRIVGDAKAEGPNLRCDVELTLESDGKPVKTNVRYTVTTSPNRTVFRDLF